MAIASMTGFGQAQSEGLGYVWTLELRSVNSKGLDLRVNGPGWLPQAEGLIAAVVRNRVFRGRVSVTLQAVPTADSEGASHVDSDAAARVHRDLVKLAKRLQMDVAAVTLDQVLSFAEVRRPTRPTLDQDALLPHLTALAQAACDGLTRTRAAEGEALSVDLSTRLEAIGTRVSAIGDSLPAQREALMTRLNARLDALLDKHEVGSIPEERLVQELALLADKADIAEELTRATAHVAVAIALIASGEPATGPLGKKLDFYFQELLRETNTMSAKNQSAEIAQLIIDNRSDIDRLREQVLNVE